MTNEQVNEFLLGKTERGTPRHEYFLKFARKLYKGDEADDAYARLLEVLYFNCPETINESYCTTIIKNFSFFCNKERTYNSRTVEWKDGYENNYDEQVHIEADTFTEYELKLENKLTDEQIRNVLSIQESLTKLPLWAKTFYKLYYIENKSFRAIAAEYKLSCTSIFNMHKRFLKLIEVSTNKIY